MFIAAHPTFTFARRIDFSALRLPTKTGTALTFGCSLQTGSWWEGWTS
jgi:hypothetical protein